jgi:pilus assembly protein CpaC
MNSQSIAEIRGTGYTPVKCGRGIWCASIILALAGLIPGAAAQNTATPPQPAPPAVQIQVHQSQSQTEVIPVAVNQGALVDFSVPVREVRVANPEIADVTATSPKQILVNGKSFGTTQLVVTADGGTQQVFTIAVDLDLKRLEASIRTLVPRAQVKVSGLLDAIVISGTVPDAESAERVMQIAGIYSHAVINHMRVAGVYQVLLRCTVAEVNRTATRQLGFNGWMAGDNFKDMFAVSQLGGINPVNIGAAGDSLVTAKVPFVTDQSGLPLSATPTLSLGFPRVQMQVFIQALRENGLLRILAEPNLVAVSGQEATFLAGGEFPIPVPQGGQNNSITIEFREFGVLLHFTPTVLSDNLIRLKVAPEVSEPDFSTAVSIGGFVVPGLTQRKVDTVVELGPGQTFAIGGLLSERTRATSSKVPALGDVPVLGALFSSVYYQSNESELVVLVTPELAAPLNPDQVTYLPGANHIPPNDWELFGLGKSEGEGNGAKTADAGADPARPGCTTERYGNSAPARLHGPVGPASGDEGT